MELILNLDFFIEKVALIFLIFKLHSNSFGGNWGDMNTKKTLFEIFNKTLAFQMKNYHLGSVMESYIPYQLIFNKTFLKKSFNF